jgi:predicted nucleic acid-binding protein
MMIVSDTSPLCYLLLIDYIDILPELYESVLIPQAVANELSDRNAPELIQNWIAKPPTWLQIKSINPQSETTLQKLDLGEQESILLAEQYKINLLLIDERAARRVAQQRNLNVVGLLGVLGSAASKELIDFPSAIARLQRTTFYASPRLIDALLEKYQNF